MDYLRQLLADILINFTVDLRWNRITGCAAVAGNSPSRLLNCVIAIVSFTQAKHFGFRQYRVDKNSPHIFILLGLIIVESLEYAALVHGDLLYPSDNLYHMLGSL